MSFYQLRFDTLYRTDEAVVCQGAAGGGRRSPACRADQTGRTSCRDKAPLSVSVHVAAEPSRLLTYDNPTVGAATVHQLHKRVRRDRPPTRRGLSQYLPAILLFVRSLFFL